MLYGLEKYRIEKNIGKYKEAKTKIKERYMWQISMCMTRYTTSSTREEKRFFIRWLKADKQLEKILLGWSVLRIKIHNILVQDKNINMEKLLWPVVQYMSQAARDILMEHVEENWEVMRQID